MNAYVIMRNDVEIGYTTNEPICVMLDNTYELRLNVAKELELFGEQAEKFAKDKCWSTKGKCTSYYIVPVELVTINEDDYKVKITRDIHLDSQTQSSVGDIEI